MTGRPGGVVRVKNCYRSFGLGPGVVRGQRGGGAAAPGEGDAGEEARAGRASPAAATGVGFTSAAIVPPKMVAVPSAASATMPVATTELVLTDTGGSIQSAPWLRQEIDFLRRRWATLRAAGSGRGDGGDRLRCRRPGLRALPPWRQVLLRAAQGRIERARSIPSCATTPPRPWKADLASRPAWVSDLGVGTDRNAVIAALKSKKAEWIRPGGSLRQSEARGQSRRRPARG